MTGDDQGWQEGGPGISGYGGKASKPNGNASRNAVQLQLSRIALVKTVDLDEVQLFVQSQYDDGPSDEGSLGIGEAHVSYRHRFDAKNRFKLRAGLLIPPVSLEHPDTAWSTLFTLTPSAINTWIGEEVRPLAFESQWIHDLRGFFPTPFTLALFSNNDPAGSILAWRGWALHDFQWRTGSNLPTQAIVPAKLAPDDLVVQPFKEIDGRPGVYGGVEVSSPEHWSIGLFHSDSLAPEDVFDDENEYTWRTRYTQLSLDYHPAWAPRLQLLSQFMWGNTWMGLDHSPGVNVDFEALYVLLSYRFDHQARLSLRWDEFKTNDLDSVGDDNDSKGEALTLAYLHPYKKHHLLGAEGVLIDNERRGNARDASDPDDDLLQIFYRLTF